MIDSSDFTIGKKYLIILRNGDRLEGNYLGLDYRQYRCFDLRPDYGTTCVPDSSIRAVEEI